MSQPNPVIVEFLTKDLDHVLKAMKSIEDIVNKTEKKSVAAAKTRATTVAGLNERQRQADMRAIMEQTKLLEAAERQGTKAVADGVRARAKAKIEAYKVADREAAKARALGESEAKKLAASEVARAKQVANAKIEAYKFADREAAKARTKGEAEAKRVVARETAAARAIAREQHRVRLEIQRGETSAAPHLSPQARLSILSGAKNKSALEQMAAVEKVRDLSDENRARRAVRKKQLAEEQADHFYIQRQITKQEDQELRERTRQQKREAKERAREDKRTAKEAEERREKFAQNVFQTGGNAVRTVSNTASRAAQHIFATTTDLGGGFDVNSALHDRLDLERSAIRFSNAAFRNRPGETRMDKDEILGQVRKESIRTNTDQTALLGGAAAYGEKSGDYKGGLELQSFFADVSKATGASVQDVAKTAGILKVQNKNLGVDEMKQLTLNTIRQGQAGSVEFSDLAKVAGNFTRSASSYAGNQAINQGKLLGLGQVAMATAGRDPREAATVISNIATDTITHADAIGNLIGQDFIKNGQVQLAPEELLARIMQETGGDLSVIKRSEKQGGLGFGQRSFKMFQALAPEFNKARDEALNEGKSKKEANLAGKEAILKQMGEMTNAAMSMEELQANVSAIMKSSAEQFETAVRELKAQVGEQLVPVMKEFIPVLRQVTPVITKVLTSLGELAAWASKNPFEAAFLGLGAAVTKEIIAQLATAKIGELIKSMLSGGGGMPPIPGVGGGGANGGVPVPGAGGGGPNGALAGGALMAGVLTTGTLAARLGDDVFGAIGSGKEAGAALGRDLDSGDPAKVEAAQKAIDDARAKATGGRKASSYADIASRAGNIAMLAINPFAVLQDEYGKPGKHNREQRNETLRADSLLEDPGVKKFGSTPKHEDTSAGPMGDIPIDISAMVDALDRHGQKLEANTHAMNANTSATNGSGASPGGPGRSGAPIGRRPGS
jgi:hypothetical protein